MRNRPDATYFPIPWVLSSRGYGLLLDQDDVSYEWFRTEAADQWSVEVESASLRYRLFAGPDPLDALRRFTAATGRQPEPARWFFGPWYQSGHANHVPLEEEERQVGVLRGSPASVVETHCRYLPLGEDRGHADEERARTEFFHSQGLAALSYINPLVGRVPPHTDEVQYDFTNPEAVRCWGDIAARLIAAGYDGWMEDFGEYTPPGRVRVGRHHRHGGPQSLSHPVPHAAAQVATELEARHERRLARFVRSGWTGSASAAAIVWGGDPTTSWGFDGLASALVEGLSMGASGVAMWGGDTGGFMSTEDRLTPELLRRWIQLSAFCPVMRTKAGGIQFPPYERPQIWDADVLPSWRRWARWHTRLNPLLSYSGPGAAAVEVGPDDIPVFVRAGAVLSLLPDDVDSLSPYAPELAERRHILAFPRVDWAGALGPDHRGRSEVLGDSWTLELSADSTHTWDVSAWLPRPPREATVTGVGDSKEAC